MDVVCVVLVVQNRMKGSVFTLAQFPFNDFPTQRIFKDPGKPESMEGVWCVRVWNCLLSSLGPVLRFTLSNSDICFTTRLDVVSIDDHTLVTLKECRTRRRSHLELLKDRKQWRCFFLKVLIHNGRLSGLETDSFKRPEYFLDISSEHMCLFWCIRPLETERLLLKCFNFK